MFRNQLNALKALGGFSTEAPGSVSVITNLEIVYLADLHCCLRELVPPMHAS